GMAVSIFIKSRKLTGLKPYQNRRFCALTNENFPFVRQRLGSGVNLFYPHPDRATPLCLRSRKPRPGFSFLRKIFLKPKKHT
ncbi:hypothetical protein, partial [Eubacterium barkeri]|uniref:hypothetical protein n=1 Tax=Eubacterium barkeri TaxID=1528 RepID=UPI001A9A37E3